MARPLAIVPALQNLLTSLRAAAEPGADPCEALSSVGTIYATLDPCAESSASVQAICDMCVGALGAAGMGSPEALECAIALVERVKNAMQSPVSGPESRRPPRPERFGVAV